MNSSKHVGKNNPHEAFLSRGSTKEADNVSGAPSSVLDTSMEQKPQCYELWHILLDWKEIRAQTQPGPLCGILS